MLKISGKQKSKPVISHGKIENGMCIPCIVKQSLTFFLMNKATICRLEYASVLRQVVRFKIQSHFLFRYQMS